MVSKKASIKIPLTGLRCLYRSTRGKKIVCEIDVASMKKVNEPGALDELVAEARLEYFAGQTKGFKDIKKLMAHLAS